MFIIEDEKKTPKCKADIRVVGVGGGGGNAVQTMINAGIKGVQFITINTDHQALESSDAEVKIQLGQKLTKGLGAGANPEIGRLAAMESYEDIVGKLQGADMVFVTAGMGGGTGTGGAPLVAQAARELDLLTVGVVTQPFAFEGHTRMKQARLGVAELEKYVDTLIMIPNEKLLDVLEGEISLLEAFKVTDNILLQAVKGIAELVSVPGLINLDFADIKTVMRGKGKAIMGTGVSEGENRAIKAVSEAVCSPLLNGKSIKGATGIIVNITASSNLSLREVHNATSVITDKAYHTADVIVGTVIDDSLGDKVSVTVIATGFSNEEGDEDVVREPLVQGVKKEEEASLNSNTEDLDFVDENSRTWDLGAENQEEAGQSEEVSEENSFENKEEEVERVDEEGEEPAEEEVTEKMEVENQSEKTDEHLQISVKENNQEEEVSEEKKPKLSEILLSKIKDYEKKQGEDTGVSSDTQIAMSLEETSEEEELSSPFESPVRLSDEDLV